MADIDAVLEPYIDDVSKRLSRQDPTIRLKLEKQQMVLFLPKIAELGLSHTIVLNQPPTACQNLIIQTKTLSELSDANQTWHLISDQLSEQEINGDVPSKLNETMHHFLQDSKDHHYVVPEAFLDIKIPSRETYDELLIKLHIGEKGRLSQLLRQCVKNGYVRYEEQLESGGIRIRGEQIDIKHPTHTGYYTITFYRSAIESITHTVDRRSHKVTNLTLPAMRFPEQLTSLRQALSNRLLIAPSHVEQLSGSAVIVYDALEPDLDFPFSASKQPTKAASQYILYENYDRVQRYADDHKMTATLCHSAASRHPLQLASNEVSLLSEASLFPPSKTIKPVSYQQGHALIAELKAGKPAVHTDHGIGIYDGLQHRTINDQTSEYLVLRYAGADTLSVPVEYAHKVTGYLGDATPTIQRLGGTAWKKTKQKAQHDAAAFAKELLKLAAERAASDTHQYLIDSSIEDELARGFPHELTPDQADTWEAIKQDLVSPQLMDRLVVGDVGFGKTELAIRAARHAVANGKQVAVLAPTTLLVQQHVDTFSKRLPELAQHIVVLSRFATPAQTRAARARIAQGTATIAIGTHALLSSKTNWDNLGLVIIDEEQRFGVAQKEYFKKIRSDLDLLSLSATPIPRTLSMALSSLKQLSIISTAPAGRKSVQSFIHQDDDPTLKKALTVELARQGQVYVVAPKVRGLGTLAHRVEQLAPKARVAIAHGQLPSQQLATVMQQFGKGAIDVLVSSTIIANGLDLPNANTIIVTKATHFGLADLYQLRGRVGRRRQQGYAYFLYNQAQLTSVQRQRLTALTEASRLGSGWAIAQRDLEIRGAGNLLGAEQSGTVNAVGVQLYLDLINEATEQQQETTIRRHDVEIELPLIASLPVHYIADEQTRTKAYQHLSRAATPAELNQAFSSLVEQYGPPPIEATNLKLLLDLQHLAAVNGITKIESKQISPSDEEPYWRLLVHGKELPSLLNKMMSVGNWQVQETKITIDVTRINDSLIGQLISSLKD